MSLILKQPVTVAIYMGRYSTMVDSERGGLNTNRKGLTISGTLGTRREDGGFCSACYGIPQIT